MIYLFEIYLLACILFLAGKDAESYNLKDRTDGPLTAGRVKRWHADGVALYVLNILPLIGWDPHDWLKTLAAASLIRLSVFDLAFNHWAGLRVTALGGTAVTDKFFVGIYGPNGAVFKSLTFFVLTIIGNILNHFFL